MENPVLTPCGHMYCKDCILQSLNFQAACPQCRNKLTGEQLYSLEKSKQTKSDKKENPFIQKYGSKLGKLIIMIRKLSLDENSKIIIFSQWDNMLSLMLLKHLLLKMVLKIHLLKVMFMHVIMLLVNLNLV